MRMRHENYEMICGLCEITLVRDLSRPTMTAKGWERMKNIEKKKFTKWCQLGHGAVDKKKGKCSVYSHSDIIVLQERTLALATRALPGV
jgi:hypothetical protein